MAIAIGIVCQLRVALSHLRNFLPPAIPQMPAGLVVTAAPQVRQGDSVVR